MDVLASNVVVVGLPPVPLSGAPPGLWITTLLVNGAVAARIDPGGEFGTAITFVVEDGRITLMHAMRNPTSWAGSTRWPSYAADPPVSGPDAPSGSPRSRARRLPGGDGPERTP